MRTSAEWMRAACTKALPRSCRQGRPGLRPVRLAPRRGHGGGGGIACRGRGPRSLCCWLALGGVLVAGAPLHAAPRGEDEVRAAAQTWVRRVTAVPRPDAVVESMEPCRRDGRLVGFIAHLAGGGFCLCGADDRLLPVYVYNPGDRYDAANPSHQFVLGKMADWLDALSLPRAGNPGEANERDFVARAARWDDLVAGRVPAQTPADGPQRSPGLSPAMMTLEVTSRWRQGPPYNQLCPFLTATEQTIVGCVATAMAQIMYYWKWPNAGQGSDTAWFWHRWQSNWIEEPLAADPQLPANWGGGGRLEWSAANGGRLRMNGFWDESVYGRAWLHRTDAAYRTALQNLYDRPETSGGMHREEVAQYADFGSTGYRWDLMHDLPANPPDAGDQLAALVSYHAGISTYMHWGIWTSSAFDNNARNGYVDHWRYDTDAVFEVRDIDRITEEIQWLRPVQLGGGSPQGGHSWVVMGYNKATDPDREFLMNIGWGGQNEWHTCDLFFPNDQAHITRIAPRDVVRFVGNTVSGDGSPDAPYRNAAEATSRAPDGATLIFKAGTVDSAPLLIDRPLTLKGCEVLIE